MLGCPRDAHLPPAIVCGSPGKSGAKMGVLFLSAADLGTGELAVGWGSAAHRPVLKEPVTVQHGAFFWDERGGDLSQQALPWRNRFLSRCCQCLYGDLTVWLQTGFALQYQHFPMWHDNEEDDDGDHDNNDDDADDGGTIFCAYLVVLWLFVTSSSETAYSWKSLWEVGMDV